MALACAQGREEEDGIAARKSRADGGRIEEIARDRLCAGRERLFRVAGQYGDVRTPLEKLPDDLGSDGSGASEDEYVHGRLLLTCGK